MSQRYIPNFLRFDRIFHAPCSVADIEQSVKRRDTRNNFLKWKLFLNFSLDNVQATEKTSNYAFLIAFEIQNYFCLYTYEFIHLFWLLRIGAVWMCEIEECRNFRAVASGKGGGGNWGWPGRLGSEQPRCPPVGTLLFCWLFLVRPCRKIPTLPHKRNAPQ